MYVGSCSILRSLQSTHDEIQPPNIPIELWLFSSLFCLNIIYMRYFKHASLYNQSIHKALKIDKL